MEFLIEKVGMSRTLGESSTAVTLLQVAPAKVIRIEDGKKALVAYASGKEINKAIEGQQKVYNLPKEFNKFASLEVANVEAGDQDQTPLENAKRVKVSVKTKGRGYTGVMKRWNFAGGPGAHGHRMHRTGGSIGNREWPGRVQRGKKMSGQYGNELVTVQCDIISYDKATGVLALKGSVPGANGNKGKIRVMS